MSYIRTSIGEDEVNEHKTARFAGSIFISGLIVYGLLYAIFHKKKKKTISRRKLRKYSKVKPLPLP